MTQVYRVLSTPSLTITVKEGKMEKFLVKKTKEEIKGSEAWSVFGPELLEAGKYLQNMKGSK